MPESKDPYPASLAAVQGVLPLNVILSEDAANQSASESKLRRLGGV
jgi:hypothetical protein